LVACIWSKSRTKEALLWLKRARSEFPGHPLVHAFLASAYALKGATERAAVELAEARKQSGDDRYSTIAQLITLGYWGVPKVRALFETTYFAGLRKAGMPEE
jgi:predicted Zn-dependent protease